MSRVAPEIVLDPMQKSQLQAWMQAPSTAQSLALRARIVLRASSGEPNQQIASALGVPPLSPLSHLREVSRLPLLNFPSAPPAAEDRTVRLARYSSIRPAAAPQKAILPPT